VDTQLTHRPALKLLHMRLLRRPQLIQGGVAFPTLHPTAQLRQDQFQHALHVPQDIVIPEPQNPEALAL
jgi:hypothetical protein